MSTSDGIHDTKVGERADYYTYKHPPRTDSKIYRATRKWLMSTVAGGCFVCGGPVDLSHPDAPADARTLHLEDHHGGGITFRNAVVAMNLFPMEWSAGWGADPKVVAGFVAQLNELLGALGEPTYDRPISSVAEVMDYVDSHWNASIKLCHPHHVGTQHQHSPDANGHEAVGIHEIPVPVWSQQVVTDWAKFDLWAGTTGTIAVAPHPELAGAVIVQHVDRSHPVRHDDGARLRVGQALAPSHPHARAAHAGYPPLA